MKSSTKLTWGIMLLISGWLLFFLGLILSATGIGACLGIPMIVLALPFIIWGAVWTWQGKVKRAEEAIATGVRQGIQQAQATTRPPTSTPPPPPVLPPEGK